MTSKTHQLKSIRKRKRHPNKANRKADLKRFMRNHAIIHGVPTQGWKQGDGYSA